TVINDPSFQNRNANQPGQPRFPNNNNRNNQNQYQATIVADEKTNSLIVTATAEDYLEIRKIVDQLDRRRPQVIIEAAIIEVAANDSLEFGFDVAAIEPPSEGNVGFVLASRNGLSDLVDQD